MASRVTTRTRAPRRKLVWARTGPGNTSLGVGPSAGFVDLLANFQAQYGAQLIGCTVMRIRGTLGYEGAAAGILTPVTFGIRVFDDSEFATLTVAQSPASDQHADWMYYQSIYQKHGSVPNVGNEDFDVRSRRKIDELGQGLIMSFHNSSGQLRTVVYQVSVLVALP